MVDQELLQRVLRLDEDERREMLNALDRSLPTEVTPELADLLDARLSAADSSPENHVPWGTVQNRMRAKVASARKSA
jgi:hypothetical protein